MCATMGGCEDISIQDFITKATKRYWIGNVGQFCLVLHHIITDSLAQGIGARRGRLRCAEFTSVRMKTANERVIGSVSGWMWSH